MRSPNTLPIVILLVIIGAVIWASDILGRTYRVVYDQYMAYSDSGHSYSVRALIDEQLDVEIDYPETRITIPRRDPLFEDFVSSFPATYSRVRPSLAKDVRELFNVTCEVRQAGQVKFRIVGDGLIQLPSSITQWEDYGLDGHLVEFESRVPSSYRKRRQK